MADPDLFPIYSYERNPLSLILNALLEDRRSLNKINLVRFYDAAIEQAAEPTVI